MSRSNLWIGPTASTSIGYDFELTVIDAEGNNASALCAITVAGPDGGGDGGEGDGGGTGNGLTDPVTLASFQGIDIGPLTGPMAGSLGVTSSTLVVMGASGRIDWDGGGDDKCYFVYVERSPPLTLTARMTTKSDVGNVGIMMRSSLGPSASNWLLGPESEDWNGYQFVSASARGWGDTDGFQWTFTSATGLSNPTPPDYNPPSPIWIRLHYDASGLCSGYWSLNGTSWTTVFSNQQVAAAGAPIFAGFCGASNWDAPCTVVWDNISAVLS